eukprot:1876595-Amphidinium_carterae.2
MMFKSDQAESGCHQVLHSDSQAAPIGRERERAIQLIPRDKHSEPPNVENCVIRPMIVGKEYMTWCAGIESNNLSTI